MRENEFLVIVDRKETGKVGNQKTNSDHLDYNTVEIGQNNHKSFEDQGLVQSLSLQ